MSPWPFRWQIGIMSLYQDSVRRDMCLDDRPLSPPPRHPSFLPSFLPVQTTGLAPMAARRPRRLPCPWSRSPLPPAAPPLHGKCYVLISVGGPDGRRRDGRTAATFSPSSPSPLQRGHLQGSRLSPQLLLKTCRNGSCFVRIFVVGIVS